VRPLCNFIFVVVIPAKVEIQSGFIRTTRFPPLRE
jgi:hypothetical protein